MTHFPILTDTHSARTRHGIERDSTVGGELVVVWRVVTTCALGCQFCGFSRELAWPRTTANVDSVCNFGKILADYQRESGRTILVSWLGGEPLDWSALGGIAGRFCDEYRLRLGVTTNGVPLASPRIRASLLAHYEQVTISVDGLAAWHDRVRGCPGLFNRIRGNLTNLRHEDRHANRLLLRVNIVLMRGNIHEFATFCEEMAAWGFQELTFNALGGNDRPEFYRDQSLLPEQVRRFRDELPGIIVRAARLGLSVRGSNKYLDRIASTANGQRIPIDDCQPGKRFLFIDESGMISPCSFTGRQYGVPMSSIVSTQALLDLPFRFQEKQREQRHSCCDDCHATFVFDKFGVLSK